MRFNAGPTTAQVLAAFTDENAVHGGRVTDNMDDGRRLIARSVLRSGADVRPGDRLQSGVAIRATGQDVWIHPYVFRLVCQNGAIMAHTIGTTHLSAVNERDPDGALQEIREAVGDCCAEAVFAKICDKIQVSANSEVDRALMSMAFMVRLLGGNARFAHMIMDQFFQEGDRSRFGLANAVTAVAREVQDPETRWDLERLGGGIAINDIPPARGDGPPTATAAQRSCELVAGSV